MNYRGPKINLHDGDEVHFPCDQCSELTHEDKLTDAYGEQLCEDCLTERAEMAFEQQQADGPGESMADQAWRHWQEHAETHKR